MSDAGPPALCSLPILYPQAHCLFICQEGWGAAIVCIARILLSCLQLTLLNLPLLLPRNLPNSSRCSQALSIVSPAQNPMRKTLPFPNPGVPLILASKILRRLLPLLPLVAHVDLVNRRMMRPFPHPLLMARTDLIHKSKFLSPPVHLPNSQVPMALLHHPALHPFLLLTSIPWGPLACLLHPSLLARLPPLALILLIIMSWNIYISSTRPRRRASALLGKLQLLNIGFISRSRRIMKGNIIRKLCQEYSLSSKDKTCDKQRM